MEAPAGAGVGLGFKLKQNKEDLLKLVRAQDSQALLEWEGFAVDGDKDGHLGLGFETVTDALMLDPLSDDEFNSLVMRVISGANVIVCRPPLGELAKTAS